MTRQYSGVSLGRQSIGAFHGRYWESYSYQVSLDGCARDVLSLRALGPGYLASFKLLGKFPGSRAIWGVHPLLYIHHGSILGGVESQVFPFPESRSYRAFPNFNYLINSSAKRSDQIVVEGHAEFLGKFLSFMTRAAFGTGDGLRLFYTV